VAYDPTYAYEVAVIIQDGLRRMYQDEEHVYYYLTVTNEKYSHPEMPEGVEEGILRGMYRLRTGEGRGARVNLLGSGAILLEVLAAADLLEKDYGVAADVFSVPSFNELKRDADAVHRWNQRHPEEDPRRSHVEVCLADSTAPTVAATDYISTYAEQIRSSVSGSYTVLGTEGYGRSDTRSKLRDFFEVDAKSIVLATLNALVAESVLGKDAIAEFIEKSGIDPDKPNPLGS